MKQQQKNKISFTTKDGKEVQFKKTGSKSKTSKVVLKQDKKITKSISALQKAIQSYNHAVESSKVKKNQGNIQTNKKGSEKMLQKQNKKEDVQRM